MFEDLSVTRQCHRRLCDFWSPWSFPPQYPFPPLCFQLALFMLDTAFSEHVNQPPVSYFRPLTMQNPLYYSL